MIQIKVELDDAPERDLRETASRFRDLSPADQAALEAIAAANRSVNFDPEHPASILRAFGGRGEVGSQSSSYADLLEIPDDELAEIYARYALEGET